MRFIVQHGDRNVIDIGIWTKRKTAAVVMSDGPVMPDAHGTTAAQVEQADEPAPGFGFAGHVKTIVSRDSRDGPASS